MASQWLLKLSGKIYGPYSSSQLKQLAAKGRIDQDTAIRKGDHGEWTRAGAVKGLFSSLESGGGSPGDQCAHASQGSSLDVEPTGSADLSNPVGSDPRPAVIEVQEDSDEYAIAATPGQVSAPTEVEKQTQARDSAINESQWPLCPSCGIPLAHEAVLCVKCGFDLRSHTKINTSSVSEPDDVEGDTAPSRRGPMALLRLDRHPELVYLYGAMVIAIPLIVVEAMVWGNQLEMRHARNYLQSKVSGNLKFSSPWFPFSMPETVSLSGTAPLEIESKVITGKVSGRYNPATREADVTISGEASGEGWKVTSSQTTHYRVPER